MLITMSHYLVSEEFDKQKKKSEASKKQIERTIHQVIGLRIHVKRTSLRSMNFFSSKLPKKICKLS